MTLSQLFVAALKFKTSQYFTWSNKSPQFFQSFIVNEYIGLSDVQIIAFWFYLHFKHLPTRTHANTRANVLWRQPSFSWFLCCSRLSERLHVWDRLKGALTGLKSTHSAQSSCETGCFVWTGCVPCSETYTDGTRSSYDPTVPTKFF